MKKQLLTHALMIMSLLSVGSAIARNIFIDMVGPLIVTAKTNQGERTLTLESPGLLFPEDSEFTNNIHTLFVQAPMPEWLQMRFIGGTELPAGTNNLRYKITDSHNARGKDHFLDVIEIPYNQ